MLDPTRCQPGWQGHQGNLKMSLIPKTFNASPIAFQAQGLQGSPLNKNWIIWEAKRHQMEGYSSSGLQGGARGDHRQRGDVGPGECPAAPWGTSV